MEDTAPPGRDRDRDLGGWDRRARAWSEHLERIDEHLSVYGAVALGWLAPAPGEWILDAGCGPGTTLAVLSERVGGGGRVCGVDSSPQMIRAARGRSKGHPNVEVRVADVCLDDLGGPYDGVYARFSLMVLDDPAAALANLHRSTRRGGRLAFTTWADLADNPWRWAPVIAAGELLGAPLERPENDSSPLTTAEQIRTALETTGWELQQLEAVRGVRRVEGIEDLAGLLSEGGPLADRWQDLAQTDGRAGLLHEVTHRLDAYRRADGLALPGVAWCALAVKQP